MLTLSPLNPLPIQSDSSSTHQEDMSSLSDLSSSALEKIDLSNESTFMKVCCSTPFPSLIGLK